MRGREEDGRRRSRRRGRIVRMRHSLETGLKRPMCEEAQRGKRENAREKAKERELRARDTELANDLRGRHKMCKLDQLSWWWRSAAAQEVGGDRGRQKRRLDLSW